MSTKERKLKEKENRRLQILNAAELIMYKNGLHSLNIDLIAQYTQLAKGTIYLYFKSKEEILSTLTIKARLLLLEEFKKIAINDQKDIDKIKSCIKMNYDFYKKYPLYYDLVSLYEANHTVTETHEMYQSSEDITKTVVIMASNAQANGDLNANIDIKAFTMCLWASTVGILQLMKVRGSLINEKMGVSESDILDNYIKIMFEGILNK